MTEQSDQNAVPPDGALSPLRHAVDASLRVVLAVELVIAFAILTALILGVGYLVASLARSVASSVVLGPEQVSTFLDVSLTLFVAIELFRIAVAYLSDEDVLHLVLEAAFIAIVRKIVLFDFAKSGLAGAAAYGLLLLVVAAAYLAVHYAQEREEHT